VSLDFNIITFVFSDALMDALCFEVIEWMSVSLIKEIAEDLNKENSWQNDKRNELA